MNARPRRNDGPLSFSAPDGRTLGGTLWQADAPRGAVLIGGATATPHRYYAAFAAWLASEGYTTLAFDYRGVGASREGPPARESATLQDWAGDLEAALATLHDAAPGLPVWLVGHSFGGQALGLSDALGEVDGALLVGAQLGWWGHWPGLSRWRMWTTWNVLFPLTLAAVGYIPGVLIGEDLPPGVAREWARWCRSPRYLLDHVPDAEARLRAFRGRAELWAFTDDDYAPEAAVRALAAQVGPGAWVRVVSPARTRGAPIGHFGPFRKAAATTLWTDVRDVLDAWTAERRG